MAPNEDIACDHNVLTGGQLLAKGIGSALRAVRQQWQLSLREVEERSLSTQAAWPISQREANPGASLGGSYRVSSACAWSKVVRAIIAR
jgi:hypothetical protein